MEKGNKTKYNCSGRMSQFIHRPVKCNLNCSVDFLATIALITSTYFYFYFPLWVKSSSVTVDDPTISDSKILAGTLFLMAWLSKIIISSSKLFSFSRKKFLIYICLLLLAGLYYKITKINTLFFGALLGFALHKDRAKDIVQATGIIALVFFILQICFFDAGLVYDFNSTEWVRVLDDGTEAHRVAFGFGHPNRVFAFILPACSAAFYWRKSYSKLFITGLCVLISVLVFFETGTKTLVIIGLALVLSPVTEWMLRRSRVTRYVAIFIFPLFFVLSIIIAEYGGADWFNRLNQMLSYRPAFWLKYINGGFQLLGRTSANAPLLNQESPTFTPIDNFFLSPLYAGGLILSLLVCFLYINLTAKCVKVKNYRLVTIILNYMVYGLSESQLQLGTIVFLPMLFSVFLTDDSILDSEGEYVAFDGIGD